MFPIPEVLVGTPDSVEWLFPFAVNAPSLVHGNTDAFVTGAGVALNDASRPLYNKLWQAHFDDTPERGVWVAPASNPSQKNKLVDAGRSDAVGLSLAFSTHMLPCVAWWNRASRCDIFWHSVPMNQYAHSTVQAEYPILLQSDIEHMFYGHSHLLLLCLIKGKLHFYHELDGFKKPTPLLPDLLWHKLDKAGMALGRRLGVVGEVYDNS